MLALHTGHSTAATKLLERGARKDTQDAWGRRASDFEAHDTESDSDDGSEASEGMRLRVSVCVYVHACAPVCVCVCVCAHVICCYARLALAFVSFCGSARLCAW